MNDIKSVFFCLFSGESGSGKTEACKHIVRHLTARSSPKGFALEPRMKHVSLVSHQVGVSSRFILLRNLYSLGLVIWIFCCLLSFYSRDKRHLCCFSFISVSIFYTASRHRDTQEYLCVLQSKGLTESCILSPCAYALLCLMFLHLSSWK